MQTALKTLEGPLWRGRNWSADAAGSIHDDATAMKLGLRGGTVAGNIHMDQFVPVLRKLFGDDFLRRGTLSLFFRNPTTDNEAVRAIAKQVSETRALLSMQREDGMEVMSGSASLGSDPISELKARDLRPCAADELRILRKFRSGDVIPTQAVHFASDKQRARIGQNLMSDPIAEYYQMSPAFGAYIASPSSAVDLLWGTPTRVWRPLLDEVVGLFGAIEVEMINGPLLMDRDYRVDAQIVALTDSPKTEGFWFDSSASDLSGRLIARHRMLLRFMKASSKHYQVAAGA